MKSPVAVLFLAVSLLSSIALGQATKKAVTKKREPSGPIKICQGVPMPDGYVIVGYVSLPACPHGAYLLKRQDTESQSISVSTRQASPPPAAASRPRRVGTNRPDPTTPDFGAGNTSNSDPPTLNGMSVRKASNLGPPVLGAKTDPSIPTGATVNASANDVPASNVEEVAEGDVVRIDTTLVTVPVSVMDRQGRFVPNLRREDFSLLENGIEQAIAYFEPTEKPFTVALVLDTSASTQFKIWEIKAAAMAFAKQLRPQDRVLVVTFNDEVLLLTEATSDQEVISAVIEQNVVSGRSTRLYDALNLVINERLNKIKGRKAIVLFTDGVDTSSYMATYQSTLREAEELDALIYPIQYDTSDYASAMQGGGNVTVTTTTSNWPFGNSSSRTIYSVPSRGIPAPGTTKAEYERADKYLHQLADKSGARLYRANDTTQLAEAFSRIAEELRRQYSLGYYPRAVGPGDERRQIRVRVNHPDLAVRARDGYLRRSSPGPTQ